MCAERRGPPSNNYLLFVVEDDDSARRALADILRLEGFEVVSAPNGKKALEYLHHSSTPPCLIILDLAMPEMDGWQFRAEQQKDPTLARIPVIVMTAFTNAEIDADAVLQKPLDLERLLDTIREYC
jgi:CheY-like chemotaxis protein